MNPFQLMIMVLMARGSISRELAVTMLGAMHPNSDAEDVVKASDTLIAQKQLSNMGVNADVATLKHLSDTVKDAKLGSFKLGDIVKFDVDERGLSLTLGGDNGFTLSTGDPLGSFVNSATRLYKTYYQPVKDARDKLKRDAADQTYYDPSVRTPLNYIAPTNKQPASVQVASNSPYYNDGVTPLNWESIEQRVAQQPSKWYNGGITPLF